MRRITLTVLLATLAPAPALRAAEAGAASLPAPLEGLPIVSIDLDARADEDRALLRSMLELEPGYLYASADVTRAVKRLFALGRFADVKVRAERRANAVALTFALEPVSILHELTLGGDANDAVQQDLKGAMSTRQVIDENTVDQIRKRCQRAWAQEGYYDARCEIDTRPADAGLDVIVKMRAGAPTRIGRLDFVGTPRAPAAELKKLVKSSQGEPYVERQVKDDERALRIAYSSRGYWQAGIRSDVQRPPNGKTADVRFIIDAGPRVQLHVARHRYFKDSELIDELRHTPEDRLTPGAVAEWRKRVAAKYHRAGFAEATVAVESVYDDKTNVLHYVLKISEGRQLLVASLSFAGAEFFSEAEIAADFTAVLSEQLAPPVLSAEVDPNDTRALLDSEPGAHKRPARLAPLMTDNVLRENPSKIYDVDAYAAAQDVIRRRYLEAGFTQIEVGPPRVEARPDAPVLNIEVPIREGPRTLVRTLDLAGNQALAGEELLKEAKFKPGDPYSEQLVEDTRAALQKFYAQRGYLYARVDAKPTLTIDLRGADVRFTIEEGPQVIVSRVILQGHEKTKSSVIRDHILLEPGQPYTPEKELATRDELTRLEIFDAPQVTLTDRSIPAERKDVVVTVIERSAHSVDAGIGVSTAQGLRGFVEYNWRNAFARAFNFSARLQLNRQFMFVPLFYGEYADPIRERYARFHPIFQAIERLARLALRTPSMPKLPGRPAFYVDLVNERRNTLPYSLDSYSIIGGVNLTLARPLTLILESSLVGNFLYCFSSEDAASTQITSGPSLNDCSVRTANGANAFIAQGFFVSAKFGPTLYLDLRDDRQNPRRGFFSSLRTDLVAGTQVQPRPYRAYDFVRVEGLAKGYIPIFKESSIALSARAGNMFIMRNDSDVISGPRNERYYLGGRSTLRGFLDGTVIAEDACRTQGNSRPRNCRNPSVTVTNENGNYAAPPPSELFGGEFFALFQGELRVPIVSDLMLGLFVDVGNLYYKAVDLDWRYWRTSVGAGLRLRTAAGSIALDFGFNPTPVAELGEHIFAQPYIYFGLF